MKIQADKKHSFLLFPSWSFWLCKIQPYVQTSLTYPSSNKLSFKFFGPFKIVDKIDEVAYKLQLPDNCLIHLVFHVSQLKQTVSPNTLASHELPYPIFHFQVPQHLDMCLYLHNNTTIPQVLVKWLHLPIDLSKWEDEEALHQEFPRAPAWGQAMSRGRGQVSDKRKTRNRNTKGKLAGSEPKKKGRSVDWKMKLTR